MSSVGLLTAFGAGFVSFLSPCVAPLLPGYLSLITSSAAGRHGASLPPRVQAIWPSLAFVFGFSLVFIALGASASVFGDLLDQYRQPLARFSGGVMILMGIVILWGFRTPFLMRERRVDFQPRTFSPSEVLLLGMAFGLGWTPCFGPILASILVYSSTADTVRYGTLLLTAYSLGLGIPFLMVGAGVGQIRSVITWGTRHAALITSLSGVTMIVVGVLLVSGQMFRLAILGQRFLSGIPGLPG
ncbi:MAG TPA: cytochrome c biogenesis protein CcdA [Thermomicrobiales bacterium]|nr:cytochrome c biogenesis protein CcdA [Thermomicrobiales bacterium]HRA30454.1 cytochrome c biogenesis protein CcdA [Thermomicrobiales bacterium]